MSATHPINRPLAGTIVEVYLPCRDDEDCSDLPRQLAEVMDTDLDSLLLRPFLEWDDTGAVSTANRGVEWTLYDEEQGTGHAIVADPVERLTGRVA